MNKADNEAGNQAIDSLINYETVKVMMLPILHVNLSSIFILLCNLYLMFTCIMLHFNHYDEFYLVNDHAIQLRLQERHFE